MRASATFFATFCVLGAGFAGAYPIPPTPAPAASATPSPPPAGNVLPFDSNVVFVLDESISSKSSKAGQYVAAHLKDPIVVDGRVIAPAGAPVKIKIVDVSPADIGDVYGFVDIFFEPLPLPDGRVLPLRAPVSRLEPHVTSGHQSTVALEDTIEDEVIPYHFLYHIFRKGKNFVLNPGSELPAHTEATLTVQRSGVVAIETPRPPAEELNAPKSSFPVEPIATPFGPAVNGSGGNRGRKTPSPLPTPTPTPAASPSATPPAPSPSASP
jgi:hypothetical protein